MQRRINRQLHQPDGKRRPYGTFSVFVEGDYVTVKQWRNGQVYKARSKIRDGNIEAAANTARAKVEEKLKRLEEGLSASKPTISVTDYIDQWITHLDEQGNKAPATIINLRQRNAGHIAKTHLGRMAVGDVTVTHVEKWLQGMVHNYAASTIAKDKACLSQAMRDAKKRGLIAQNPVAESVAPRSRVEGKTLEALTAAEFGAMLRAAQGLGIEAAIALGLLAALRPGEVTALTWADVDFDSGIINVRASMRMAKGGQKISGPTKNQQSNAQVAMAEELAAILQRVRRAQQETRLRHGIGWTEHLHCAGNEIGEPRHNSAVGNQLRELGRQTIGRSVSPQELRRSATTRLLALGHSEADVLKVKRSTDVKTLRKSYDKRGAEDLREITRDLGKLGVVR
jgi:integrase